MYRPKFSPKEALAAAIHGVIKLLMLQHGYDDNTADLEGAAIGGTVKRISIEKQTSIYSEIENAIKSAWIDIFSKEDYEYLSDDCKEELKKRVVSVENTFEIINANQPGSLLRSRIISILKQYTKWNGIELNTMARLMSDALLKEIYKIFDKDGILTLIARTDALLKNQNITIDRIRKLDDIQDSLQELSTDFYKQIEILQLIAHESQEHTDENLINKLREHCQNEDKKKGRLTEQSFIDFISSINVRRWNLAFNSSDSYRLSES